MLIVLQFPISDLRSFLEVDTGRGMRPSWPLPVEDEEFIRSFGHVRRRWRGGLASWVGENWLCIANRVLRIPPTPQSIQLFRQYRFRVVFRTFFSDGNAVGKMEIGIASKPSAPGDTPMPEIVKALLALPVQVPNSLTGTAYEGPLVQAGKHLALQYLAATSKVARHPDVTNNSWWVAAGAPVLVVERVADEQWAMPGAADVYAGSGDWPAVEHRLVQHAGRRLNYWSCTASPWGTLPAAQVKARQTALREMRISLLRIHAEREALLNVVRAVEQGRIAVTPRSAADTRLQRYLRDATKRILQQEAEANIPAVALANQYDELATPGVRESMLASLESMRPFVQKLVGSVVNAQATLTAEQRKQLQEALIDAFDANTLAMMVRQELNERLDVIVGGGPFGVVVFNLLGWAERTGCVGKLVQGAVAYNPGNSKLQAAAQALA